MASRVDVGEKAQAQYRNARDRWLRVLGSNTDPASITPAGVVAGIAEFAKTLQPATIEQYLSTLRQVVDFCDVAPNPARSPKVKVPTVVRDEINPPRTDEWMAIAANVTRRSSLAIRLIECCGLRVSEACNLAWGDLDLIEGQIRVARTKTAAGRRWVPVPDDLLDEIEALCPLEDRSIDRRVLGVEHGQVRRDLAQACVAVSRWAGHARSSMSLDVYGHVILDPHDDAYRDFWTTVYDAKRRRGVVPVWSEEVRSRDSPARSRLPYFKRYSRGRW